MVKTLRNLSGGNQCEMWRYQAGWVHLHLKHTTTTINLNTFTKKYLFFLVHKMDLFLGQLLINIGNIKEEVTKIVEWRHPEDFLLIIGELPC